MSDDVKPGMMQSQVILDLQGRVQDHHERLYNHGQRFQSLTGLDGDDKDIGRVGRLEEGLESMAASVQKLAEVTERMHLAERERRVTAAEQKAVEAGPKAVTSFKVKLIWTGVGIAVTAAITGVVLLVIGG